jgi:hypothetical protein
MPKSKWFLAIAVLGVAMVGNTVLAAETADQAADANAAEPRSAYVFSFFRDNGQDGVYLALSEDGLTWREVHGGRPVLTPQVGGKLTRDPSICRGPDGLYHMVWTTSWTDKGFGVAHSKDLLNWSEQRFVPVNADEPKARNTWAPEIFYDDASQQYIVVWATTIEGLFPETQVQGDRGLNHRLYATTTKDFQTWTPKQLFYDGGFNVIDGFLFQWDGKYGMVVKDETIEPVAQKNLRMVWSEDGALGPWGEAGPPLTDNRQAWAEGPAVIRMGDRWLIYYDKYNKGGYGAVETRDFVNFTPVQVSLPKGIRHGTIVQVDRQTALGLAAPPPEANADKIRVILDTDANNELDDQHAIAYLLFNGDVFDVEAITVNRTRAGGGVDQHLAEAQRVVRLCGLDGKIPVLRGADQAFDEIRGQLDQPDFDGAEAVDFMIQRAMAADPRRLVLLPVGKLTNIALALAKEPAIIPRVRIVWLGSNYPDPGEYNQVNDEPSLNYILNTGVDFEIAIVRYGKPSGTDAVRATLAEIQQKMPGTGPRVTPPVTGRHDGQFSCFGDYSVSLFKNIRLHGDPPSRALFDMAAVAIVKNPAWATAVEMPAPILQDGRWVDRPDNARNIVLWENFDRQAIMADFYDRMNNYQLTGDP